MKTITQTREPFVLYQNGAFGTIKEGTKTIVSNLEINRAARIVRAVNSHEEMLSALKLALARLPQDDYGNHARKEIMHVIAKAEGKL